MACPHCTPELDRGGPREGEHHFAVRFGPQDIGARVFETLPGGTEIQLLDVFEVFAGVDGTAWRVLFEGRAPRRCECGQGAAVWVAHGNYRVEVGRGSCASCRGERWVCEAHPRRPSEDCGCGAPGMPCEECNTGLPPEYPPGSVEIWSVR